MSCSKTKGFTWSREAIGVLVDLYEQHYCLYLVTSKEYHNKTSRIQALESITRELNQKLLTTLTVQDVQKKLHGLRTQYLSEVRKIKKSKVTGISHDKVYTPTFWCFERLQFLDTGAEIVTQGESSMNPMEQSADQEDEGEVVFEGTMDEIENWSPPQSPPGDSQKTVQSRSSTPSTSTIASSSRSSAQKRKRKADEKPVEDLLKSAHNTLSQLVDTPKTDVNTLFANMVAAELDAIKCEDIVDDLKQEILLKIFEAKRKYRNKNK